MANKLVLEFEKVVETKKGVSAAGDEWQLYKLAFKGTDKVYGMFSGKKKGLNPEQLAPGVKYDVLIDEKNPNTIFFADVHKEKLPEDHNPNLVQTPKPTGITKEEQIALRLLTSGLVVFEHDFSVVIKIIETATGQRCHDPMIVWEKYKELRKDDLI